MEQRKGSGGLPANAYKVLQPGEQYVPYVPAGTIIPEITVRSVAMGLLMAFIFTAAAAYLGLKIGQVFEAAIPIAILAVGLGGLFKRRSTILENVIIQSIGSTSGAVVAGMIFTLPAIIILGLDLKFYQTFISALLGGFLGILFLVPLRRYFVKEQHGHLPFPEGTAINEVLVTGEKGGDQAKVLIVAALIGGIYDFCIATFGFWSEVISTRLLPPLAMVADKAKLVVKVNAGAAVMGLGYIIGMKYSTIITCGSLLSWLVFIPLVWLLSPHLGSFLGSAAGQVSQMSPEEIFTNYVRHIGIGGIAVAGIIGVIKSSKIIVSSFSVGIREMFAGKGAGAAKTERTDTDLNMSIVIGALIITLLVVLLFFGFAVVDSWGIAVIALIVVSVISFLFTTVAARAIAIVGMNPVSGMTLMTLILSSLILVKAGLSGPAGMVSALIIGGVVCTALSTAGSFITDLKVGYWLGSSPNKQEGYKFLGIIVAAASVTGVIMLLDRVYGFTGNTPMAAPQANAMAAVIQALMSDAQTPWGLYMTGGVMAVKLELLKISPLSFALGMYLPIQLVTPLFVGGLVAHFVGRSSKNEEISSKRKDRGTLIASGFIAGGALMGVVSALVAFFGWNEFLHTGFGETTMGGALSVILFTGLCLYMYFDSKKGAAE